MKIQDGEGRVEAAGEAAPAEPAPSGTVSGEGASGEGK
jgi:hypothetical protein